MFEEIEMRSAAIYVRISSDDEGTALGVKRQTKDCLDLAKQRGWTVTHIYTDNDISASSGKPRPEYERLFRAIRNGVHDGVIVWDLDRLHRRPAELEEFIDLADDYRIALASVGGDVDLSTAQGRFVARVKGALAGAESENLSRRIRRKLQELAENGMPSGGGIRSYGFARDGMTIIPAEAEVIRVVALRVLDGEALRGIAHDLDRRGVPTISGRPWSPRTLRDILLRPRTAGLRQHQGHVIGPAAWPAILDLNTWETVRVILTNPDRRPPSMTNVRKHLLNGIAKCGVCKDPLISHHDTRGEGGYLSYVCRKRGCRKVRVSIRHLDEAVTDLVLTKLERESVFPHVDEEQERLADEIEALKARLITVAEEFADDEAVDPDQVRAMSRRLRKRLNELYSRQAERAWSDVLDGIEPAHLRLLWDKDELTLARKRGIIAKVTKGSLLVYPASRRGPGFDPTRVDVSAWREGGVRS